MKNNYMICMMAILSLYNIGINAVEPQSDDDKTTVKKTGTEVELKEVDIVKKTKDFLADKSYAEMVIIENVVYWEKRKRRDDALRSKHPEFAKIIESLEVEREKIPESNRSGKYQIDRKINLIKDLMVINDFDPIPESNEEDELDQLEEQIRCNEYDRNKPQFISEIPLYIEKFIEDHYPLFKSYRAGNSTAMDLLNAINKFFDALDLYNNK